MPVSLRHPVLLTGAAFLLLWLAAGKSYPVVCNDASRLAAIESLATRGTFEISDSMFIGTCDKVRIPPDGAEGRYYSDKPPLLSMIGAVVYKALTILGLDVRRDLALVYRLLNFFLVALPTLAMLWLVVLHLGGLRDEKQWWAVVATLFGTLALTYSVVINGVVPAAACLLGAYVFLTRGRLATAGLLLGLAVSFEYATALFALALGFLCLAEQRRNVRGVLLFAVLAALPVLATMLVNYQLSGHWKPVNLQVERYLYPGGIQRPEFLLGGKPLSELTASSLLLYLWHGWLGYKGILSHSAALLLGFLGLRLALRNAEKRRRALAVLGAVGATAIYFCLDATHYFGGSCYGYRYMIPWMPLVALFAYELFEAHGVKPWMKAVVVVSMLTSAVGLRSPWLIHNWAGLELDTFDFFLVHDERANPYVQAERSLEPMARDIASLRGPETVESLSKLAFLHYRAIRPEQALGYLQLLGDRPERHCYSAIVFSEKGLNLPDLMARHQRLCPQPEAPVAPAKKP